jgi:hypothetical protein
MVEQTQVMEIALEVGPLLLRITAVVAVAAEGMVQMLRTQDQMRETVVLAVAA